MAIYINTSQNVQIQFEISSVADRIVAYLIDSLIIAGISIATIMVGMATTSWIAVFVVFIVIFFYHLLCEIFMNGQSFGKRDRGIRVIKKDGTAASISAYFLRFLLRPIDSIYGLGLAVIFLTERNQRLGDLAAGTIVVKVKSEGELKSALKNEFSAWQDTDIKYPEAERLSEQDVQVIRKVLENRKEDKTHENVQMLAYKLYDKIGVEIKGSNAYYGLQRLVQDYHKIHAASDHGQNATNAF